jgi:phosphoglycolate phosphatase
LRTKEEILAAISFGRREFVERILPEGTDECIIREALAEYTQYYGAHFMDTTQPYDGIIELLQTLHQMGYRTAVVTNKAHPNAVEMVSHVFPAELVDGVWGLDRLPPKPNPSIALAAAQTLGVAPEECFFIGDSELDILTAQNAGMTPVGVSWGYRSVEILQDAGATLIAHSAKELEAILTRASK